MSNKKWVSYQRTTIIGNTKGRYASARARKENLLIDIKLELLRQKWVFTPSNMIIILHQDAGAFPAGLVLSVPHEVGRMILHKRLGRILEHDVKVDATVEGSFEDAVEAMNLVPINATA